MIVEFNVDKEHMHSKGIYLIAIDGKFFFGRTKDFWKEYVKIHHKLILGEQISGRMSTYLETHNVTRVNFASADVGDNSYDNLRKWIKMSRSHIKGFNSNKPFAVKDVSMEDFIYELGVSHLKRTCKKRN